MFEKLKEFRKDWKEEIPEKVIHSNDTNKKYKVRRVWFQGVVGIVESLLMGGHLKPDQVVAANSILEKFTSEEFHQQELTTRQDIETANSLIDTILKK
jgi:hypothetical protein